MLSREERLIGKNKVEKITNSTVCIVGIGGVGGYVVELLARAGVGRIIIVDGDTIDISNVNRQIIATSNNVGEYKVDAFEKRMKEINPNILVKRYAMYYTNDNKVDFSECDYVVDAIDSINDKVELICDAKEQNIPIVSAMGAGNRIEPTNFVIKDIYKTEYDGLAKKLRKLLRERGIKKLPVAIGDKPALKLEGKPGSMSYTPAACGIAIAAFVINELIKED